MRAALLLILTLLVGVPAALGVAGAATDRTLTWEDLSPPPPDLGDPFPELRRAELFDLDEIAQARSLVRRGDITEDDIIYQDSQAARRRLLEAGHDVDALVAEFEAIMAQLQELDRTTLPELDGQEIAMPGYVLPLEFDGEAIREFLLVPYVGACIHVPAPPPNQVVFVTLDEPYQPKGLYDAVWITGTLLTETRGSSFESFDGTVAVESGYRLKAKSIDGYADQGPF